jgi:hypothetical protein
VGEIRVSLLQWPLLRNVVADSVRYGCNELLFHPFRLWFTRGPFTPLFRKFIGSNMRLTSKITIMAYIGTYYAIGAAWILTLANYFLIGWFNGHLDHYYLDSFKVYFSLIIVFSALGNVALAVLRYRISEKSLLSARKLYSSAHQSIANKSVI